MPQVCLTRQTSVLLPIFVLVLSSVLSAAEPSAESLLKARIVQLEGQLAEAMRRINILTVQVSELQQPDIAKTQAASRAQAEAEAGCVLDWTENPVQHCKPEKPNPEAPK